MPRLPCLLLLLAGCSASGTSSSSSSSTGGTPEPGASSDGGTSTPTPVCTDETDFEADAKNCGRCGRACDDGACKAGVCAARVEATSAGLPDTIGTEIAVVEGRLFASTSYSPNIRTTPSTKPLVRFENGKPVTVLPDAGLTCLEARTECLVTDGKTLFVHTLVGDQNTGTTPVIKRFKGDGTPLKDMFLPGEGYGFPAMSAEAGRLLVRGIVGPTALFAEDGKAVRLTELRNGSWPVLAGGEAYVANNQTIERVAVGSGTSTIGTLPRTSTSIRSIAANDRFIYVLAEAASVPIVHRFTRMGNDAPPERNEPLSEGALATLNAASIDVPGATVRVLEERAVVHENRFYFTLVITSPDFAKSARVIVEWSEDRGFRSVGTIPGREGSGTRLVVGKGRLYWLEQPPFGDNERPVWRIVSVPL